MSNKAQNPKSKKIKFPSELRFDLISKDWVVIATGRARMPETFKAEKRKIEKAPMSKCPFCQIASQEKPTLIFSDGKKLSLGEGLPENWTTIVIPNKYPAFLPHPKLDKRTEGNLYETINAVGFHEVVVTRDHEKQLAQFSLKQVKEVFDVYQERYLDLMKKPLVNYISIFHNHGSEAGASVAHPHSQIITTPLVDVDVQKGLLNSEKYFKTNPEGKPSVSYGANKKCIYCQMNDWERKKKKRVVFENRYFLAICPFASKSAFEVIISPKEHSAYFEKITEERKWQLSEVFQIVFKKLYSALNNPSYNFYLHNAPNDGRDYQYYHWHWTILPKTGTWAGFELGTRMEISTITPEKAAEYLRSMNYEL